MNAIPKIDAPMIFKDTNFLNSEFVEIVSGKFFDIEMQYPLLKLEGAEKHCYVRNEVYDKLIEAAEHLPTGYKFRILDAWRPLVLQYELYNFYSERITRDFKLNDCPKEHKMSIISKFISEPIRNEIFPPVHTTGGAVDLSIIGPDNQELDMGSKFDEFSDRSYTAYYEKSTCEEIKENRRILYNAMINAGFTNLPSEWWHYDYGDRFWAYYHRKPALYKGVFTKEEILFGKQ